MIYFTANYCHWGMIYITASYCYVIGECFNYSKLLPLWNILHYRKLLLLGNILHYSKLLSLGTALHRHLSGESLVKDLRLVIFSRRNLNKDNLLYRHCIDSKFNGGHILYFDSLVYHL